MPQDFQADQPGTSAENDAIPRTEAKALYADTSDVEEQIDSSSVEAFPPASAALAFDPASFPGYEGDFHSEFGHSDAEQDQYRANLSTADRQLTGKGKAVIKKYFSQIRPSHIIDSRTPNHCP